MGALGYLPGMGIFKANKAVIALMKALPLLGGGAAVTNLLSTLNKAKDPDGSYDLTKLSAND